jgi:hypothetical protein
VGLNEMIDHVLNRGRRCFCTGEKKFAPLSHGGRPFLECEAADVAWSVLLSKLVPLVYRVLVKTPSHSYCVMVYGRLLQYRYVQ